MRQNFLQWIILSILALFSASFCNSHKLERGFPKITNYSPKEYNADTQNWAVVQDKRGVMYFGNNSGLLEFDGTDWRLYPMLNNSTIRTLAIGGDGRIYTGSIGDLGYFQPDSSGRLTFHSLLPYVPENVRDFSDVWQVLIFDGRAYFNVDKYIFIWDIKNKSFKIIEGKDNFHLLFLVNGKIYARQWGVGLQVLQGDSLVMLKGSEKFSDERLYVILPFPGEVGTILIATRNMGMFKYDGKQFISFKTEADDFIRKNLLYYPGLILNSGNILLATLNDGVIIIDRNGKEVERFTRKSGIFSPVIYSQLQDLSGAIWLTTDNGITRIDYSSEVSYFDSRNHFSTSAYQMIRYKGIIYAASNNGVYYLDPLTSEFHQLANSNNQSVVFQEIDDDLLVGTLDGLFKIENFLLKPVRKTNGSEYDVNDILHSNRDPKRIFIGAVGLWSLYREKNSWRDEGQIFNFEDIANSMEEDPDGTLWVGTNTSGLFKIRLRKDKTGKTVIANPSVEKFDSANGLPEGSIQVKKINNVNYFLSVKNFYRFDSAKQRFFIDNSLKVVSQLQNYISTSNIKEDKKKRLWISMGREPALGTLNSDGSYKWLKTPFKRFSKEIIASIYPENENIVWFSTSSSVIKYDLTKASPPAMDYRVLIRRVVIGPDSTLYYGSPVAKVKIPEIDFRFNSLNFTFSAPVFEDDGANQYKTILLGNDESWSLWSKEHKKEYTNLSPGRYTFKVIAKNIFGVESHAASYSFEIMSPWYRTWAAYLLYVLLFAGAVFAVDRFQRRRLMAKEKEKMIIQVAEYRAESAELQAKAAEAQAQLIQAENQRKTKELEEARALQLSMLPEKLPQWSGLDIAVYMQTATEVGGDYYDFSSADNDSYNIAIGDATGHGMKAGIMVSAMKSIFATNASKMSIESFFAAANSGVKGMGIKRMMMGFAMVNIDHRLMKLINAGLPPVFFYKQKTGQIEELSEHGMPFGAMSKSNYKTSEKKLAKGDAILLLSDGLPELMNEGDEMFGYERITSLFKQIAHKSPDGIIEDLKNAGLDWGNGKDPDDDVTIVVIKMK